MPVRSIVMPHATSAASASTQTGTSKRTSWHRRTKSMQMVPLIQSSSTSHDEFASVLHPSNKPWQFDVESDEEVPAPTILEAAIRRSIAKAHVESKLGRLRVESAAERQQRGASWSPTSRKTPRNHEDILLIGAEDLGILCPSNWRTTGLEGVLLDRTWLHEVNPFAFDEDGVLRAPHLYMKKPKSVPLLYWKWIKDDIPIHGQPERWAEGWTVDGPTVVWANRWRDGELTAKEINGRRRVGFTLDEDVFEI